MVPETPEDIEYLSLKEQITELGQDKSVGQ